MLDIDIAVSQNKIFSRFIFIFLDIYQNVS